MASGQHTVQSFNRRMAEGLGSIQVVMGTSFIGLSLACIYYGYTLLAQMSPWFSLFWVLGGTTGIFAGSLRTVNMVAATLLFSLLSLLSTVVYITILSYQLSAYMYSDTQLGLYSGMMGCAGSEFILAILAFAQCAKALCDGNTRVAFTLNRRNKVMRTRMNSNPAK